MGDVEAAGDLITGGLIAGAIERESRTRASGETHHALCLNCGTGLLGAYCHRCGQSEHIHRSLSGIWHDIAHGVLHFEGKIWNTLPLLAWRPGDLTRRYIHGERARFVSPMALFLFSIFLVFAVFGAFGLGLKMNAGNTDTPVAAANAPPSPQIAEIRKERADLDARIAAAKARGQDTTDLERERTVLTAASGIVENGLSSDDRTIDVNTGIPAIDKAIAKANDNPNLLLYKIQSNAYKFGWALIPISTPLLWLLFAWRRTYRFYDHAVFVTYSLAFMSLLAVALTLLSLAPIATPALVAAAVLIPPLHMYRQMRGAYSLGRLNALVRTTLLIFMAQFALIAYAVLLITLGAFG
jgi:chorismate mutase